MAEVNSRFLAVLELSLDSSREDFKHQSQLRSQSSPEPTLPGQGQMQQESPELTSVAACSGVGGIHAYFSTSAICPESPGRRRDAGGGTRRPNTLSASD